MKNFEYAQPRTESEAIQLLATANKKSVVLAGGTDLVGLLKKGVEEVDRVVNIQQVASFRSVRLDGDGNTWVGAAVTLDEVAEHDATCLFPSITQVINGISSPQLQAQGTLVGELLRRPTCWYYRNGHGLLANQGKLVVEGDNRYHAILGNRGPAKFVHASRLAPALISLHASLRIVGPSQEDEQYWQVSDLFQTPQSDEENEHCLQPGQLITHVIIPPQEGRLSASYEVRQGEGPDQPLASASVNLKMSGDRVEFADIVLGQVAPTPWLATEAAQSVIGQPINEDTAATAGREAVLGARPLSGNEYKIHLATVSVKRALLRAVGMETGGLDQPVTKAANRVATGELIS